MLLAYSQLLMSLWLLPVSLVVRYYLSRDTFFFSLLNKEKKIIKKAKIKLIQIGEVTHTQDQAIYPVSFKPTNKTHNRTGKICIIISLLLKIHC